MLTSKAEINYVFFIFKKHTKTSIDTLA